MLENICPMNKCNYRQPNFFRTFLVPMITKDNQFWSNFWGAIGSDGFYVRSPDYSDIIQYIRRGVWNVPYVSHIYLIKSTTIDQMVHNPFSSTDIDQDMIFSANARDRV